MKKIFYILPAFLLLPFLGSCDKELMDYEGQHIVSPEKDELLEWLSNMFFDRSNAQRIKINEYLQTFNIPYRLEKSSTTRNKKTVRSIKVVKAEDFTE